MKFKKFGKALLMSALSAGVVLSVTSCVQSYSVGYLYVTGTHTAQPAGNGIVSGFKIDHNTGKLTSISGLPVASGGANPIRAVLLAGSRFLYVLNRGVDGSGDGNCSTADPCAHSNITQFAVGGNGILTQQQTFYPQGLNPERMIADSNGNFVFILDHDAPSAAACSLALGPSATSCGAIEVYAVNQTTGRLQIVVNAQVTSASGQPLPYFPIPADPIDFVMAGGSLLTLSGTPATGDSVFPYTYNGSNGQLTINQNSSQPLNIYDATAINYGAGTVYVLDNEAITVNGVTSPSQILPYSVGSGGALQAHTGGAVPDDPTLANPTQLLVEAKGNWVYVANQGNNNTGTGLTQNGIAAWVINKAQSELTPMPKEPFPTGSGPQCIVEDPSNQFIYTANYNDSTVTGRVLDQNAGTLSVLHNNSSFSLSGPATWCLVDGRTN
ncbi:MAG: beta-propeller fold lactonase family protein [Terracidiphilus sp.]